MKLFELLFESKAAKASRERRERELARLMAEQEAARRQRELAERRKESRVSESQWINLYKD